MQACNAGFYSVSAKKRSGVLIKILLTLLCAAVLTVLVVRVFNWTDKRQGTELLVLVNPWNEIDSSEFKPKLTDIGDGKQADVRCVEALEQMLSDCRAAGYSPYICSAYRSRETQQQLFDNKVQRVIDSGVSPEEAPQTAAAEVARPGSSEHELGLAFDIVDLNYQNLDESQADTETQKWLTENCWKYGFILRYPKDGTDVTGIIYEPWHYRYVGIEAAEQIMQLNITLEEYLTMFYSEEAEVVFES